MPASYLRSLNPRLPLPVWLLQVGGLANSFGNGLALPFLVIYLHKCAASRSGRPVSSWRSRLRASSAGSSSGRRSTASARGGCSPRARPPGHRLRLLPLVRSRGRRSRSSARRSRQRRVLAEPVDPHLAAHPAARRHAAFAQQRVDDEPRDRARRPRRRVDRRRRPAEDLHRALRPRCAHVPRLRGRPRVHPRPGVEPNEQGDAPASYRAVLSHKTFLGLWRLNFLFVLAGYSLLTLLPAFAHDQAERQRAPDRSDLLREHARDRDRPAPDLALDRGPSANARARADAPALGGRVAARGRGGFWLTGDAAFAVIALAAGILGIGECFHGPAHQALVSDIGPPNLRGRYFAVHSLSWGLGGNRRPGRRRLHPRGGAVRPLAARLGGLPRRGRSACSRSSGSSPRRSSASRARTRSTPSDRGARAERSCASEVAHVSPRGLRGYDGERDR